MELQPIGDKIIIKPVEVQTISPGGIHIPEKARERAAREIQRGVVIAVGDGIVRSDGQFQPNKVRPGDHVMYAQFGGTHVEINDEELIVMMERDIHCIVKGDGPITVIVPSEPEEDNVVVASVGKWADMTGGGDGP